MKRITMIATGALLVLSAGAARAQSFPADDDWFALECGGGPMTDAVMDEPGATLERDIVGDGGDPAGLRAIDFDFAYFRLRLDADPVDQGELLPSTWGFEIDLDDDTSTYEVLILASGLDQTISLFSNDVTTSPDDPTDPADQPPVAVYDFVDNGRSASASSDFGGDGDRFLDVAIPWDDLEGLGITLVTELHVWAASSSSDDSLDGDFACHDGGDGDPSLGDIASDPTVLDPDPDGGGGGGGGTGEPMLEGGGGCAAGGGAPAGAGLLLLALLLGLATRARSRASSTPSTRR
jgi:hypothetical protein